VKVKYWLQVKAPAGNWVDSIGCNDKQSCLDHAKYSAEQGEDVQVVERVDTVIWSTKRKEV
jgi:hypothetical protein